MTDAREAWGGLCGLRRPQNRRRRSQHAKYGKTYYKTGRPSVCLSPERLKVAKSILKSLGKEPRK